MTHPSIACSNDGKRVGHVNGCSGRFSLQTESVLITWFWKSFAYEYVDVEQETMAGKALVRHAKPEFQSRYIE